MSEHIMTREEREEYDALLYEAGYDEDGKARPSHEIGPLVVAALREAAHQAHRPWAGYVLDDVTEAGALARWRGWNRARETVTVAGATYVTTKPAAMAVRRRSAETGETYYQSTIWDDMSRADLIQLVDRTAKEIETERRTIATARRLLEALDRAPEATTVAEAMAALGTTVAEYLGTWSAA